MTRLFIFHNPLDEAFAARLADDLNKICGNTSIENAPINEGGSLVERITEGNLLNDYAGVVISENSISSAWIPGELDTVWGHNISKKVFRILLNDVRCPDFLSESFLVDFRKVELYHRTVVQLSLRLESCNGGLSEIPTSRIFAIDDTPAENRLREGLRCNKLGMSLMQWSGQIPDAINQKLYPEGWQRRNDGATWAVDSGDFDMYQQNIAEMKELETELSQDVNRFSSRALIFGEAAKLFKRAALCGDPEGYWNLGWRYELGQGVVSNNEFAVFCWACAGRLGHAASCLKLRELGVDCKEFFESRPEFHQQILSP